MSADGPPVLVELTREECAVVALTLTEAALTAELLRAAGASLHPTDAARLVVHRAIVRKLDDAMKGRAH